MDVKQAIKRAKNYLTEVFSDENISGIRLEEVVFDKRDDAWLVTLGLMRPGTNNKYSEIAAIAGNSPLNRSYKIVKIPSDENEPPSINIREVGPVGD